MNTKKIQNKSRKRRFIKLSLSEQEFRRISAIAESWGITPTKLVTHVEIFKLGYKVKKRRINVCKK